MANLFKKFKELLPEAPLLIGTVQSTQTGQAFVQLPSGAVIRARGQADVGQRVFVRDGAIEGEAPNLTVKNVEI